MVVLSEVCLFWTKKVNFFCIKKKKEKKIGCWMMYGILDVLVDECNFFIVLETFVDGYSW